MAEAAAWEEEGEFIVIKSPYGDNIELFDNEEMLSDLLFVCLWGRRRHRGTAAASRDHGTRVQTGARTAQVKGDDGEP